MPISYPKWRNFQFAPNSHCGLFFLHTLPSTIASKLEYALFYQNYAKIATFSVKKCLVLHLYTILASKHLAENDIKLMSKRHPDIMHMTPGVRQDFLAPVSHAHIPVRYARMVQLQYSIYMYNQLQCPYCMSLITRKPVFGVCDQVGLNPDYSAKEACYHHHHHIHFRALFSSTEGWAFWQVFLEGVLSTQNDSEGQQNPYLASFCHSQALHPMIFLACQIFSVQPHSACVLLQSSLCWALHVQTISSCWCGAPHLSLGCQALWEGSLS